MLKVKIISSSDSKDFEDKINCFIEDKVIKEIKFSAGEHFLKYALVLYEVEE